MRALLQRATRGEVRVGGDVVGAIGPGLVILLGVGPDDTDAIADDLARRSAELRIFRDEDGRTNRSLLETGGSALVVARHAEARDAYQREADAWREAFIRERGVIAPPSHP